MELAPKHTEADLEGARNLHYFHLTVYQEYLEKKYQAYLDKQKQKQQQKKLMQQRAQQQYLLQQQYFSPIMNSREMQYTENLNSTNSSILARSSVIQIYNNTS